MELEKSYVYGPVPSRRLGFSLGLDLVPYKSCSYDCIYCQLGRTTNKTVERKEYVSKDIIISQLASVLEGELKIDYITFSGSGEPTLNSSIGDLIREIKKMTQIKVAILTNGSLFHDGGLRHELASADLVIPSLDAGLPSTFERINRPESSIEFNSMVDGLAKFRKDFKGQIWLEVMLVKEINDSIKEIGVIESLISKINPDKLHLNTVIRPPAEKYCMPVDEDKLKRFKSFFGKNCEIIAEFSGSAKRYHLKDIDSKILEVIKRRPCTITDISVSLGIPPNEVIKHLDALKANNKVKYVEFGDKGYYKPV